MKVKVDEILAYYLPQFHQIPENNKWWGEGFTEWVKVKNAKPLYHGHILPQPTDYLGYYDLTDVQIIEKQYKLAKQNSISTFCFWHYWFDDNDMLLQKPAENILQSNIDIKFCFAWANHSWWNKTDKILLKKQTYDYSLSSHFDYLLKFFMDPRYTKIDNKPVFLIYNIKDVIDAKEMVRFFDQKAKESGFDGIYFIGENLSKKDVEVELVDQYLNSCNFMKYRSVVRKVFDRIIVKAQDWNVFIPRVYNYHDCVLNLNKDIEQNSKQLPVILPGWDSSIRHGRKGVILNNSNPESFEMHVKISSESINQRENIARIVMVKSWNEWAEGNYMEPCNLHGDTYLKILNKYFQLRG